MHRALLSSAHAEWPTPAGIYDRLNEEFRFTLDPCPIGGTENGLARLFCPWHGHTVFCNPPYGRKMRDWLERWKEPSVAVYLIPARTDTKWFLDVILPFAKEIRFIRGRLRFGDAKNCAPFPSMLAIFEADFKGPQLVTEFGSLNKQRRIDSSHSPSAGRESIELQGNSSLPFFGE